LFSQNLFSLFKIRGNYNLAKRYIWISIFVGNIESTALSSICQNVLLTGHPQSFFLSSGQCAQIPQNLFDSMNDFRIILSNGEIKFNHIFASMASNKTLKQLKEHPNHDLIISNDLFFVSTFR
jgi:hypothetical protein